MYQAQEDMQTSEQKHYKQTTQQTCENLWGKHKEHATSTAPPFNVHHDLRTHSLAFYCTCRGETVKNKYTCIMPELYDLFNVLSFHLK